MEQLPMRERTNWRQYHPDQSRPDYPRNIDRFKMSPALGTMIGGAINPDYDEARKRAYRHASWIDTASNMAPAAGTAIGAGVGALAAGIPTSGAAAPAGGVLGGVIGGGIGAAAGAFGQGWADRKRSKYEDQDMEKQMQLALAAALLQGYA
jgi:hypothetical protein